MTANPSNDATAAPDASDVVTGPVGGRLAVKGHEIASGLREGSASRASATHDEPSATQDGPSSPEQDPAAVETALPPRP